MPVCDNSGGDVLNDLKLKFSLTEYLGNLCGMDDAPQVEDTTMCECLNLDSKQQKIASVLFLLRKE